MDRARAELRNRTPAQALVVQPTDRKWGVASKADEYRRRAQVCLEMARAFGDRNARVSLAHMAEAWTRLADKLDAHPTIGALKGGDENRPAVQQQQQIQPKDD